MESLQACLSGREDRESSFHHCGSPLSLVHGHDNLNLQGCTVKYV